MQYNLSARVHDILQYGLATRRRLAEGADLDLGYVQVVLLDMLQFDEESLESQSWLATAPTQPPSTLDKKMSTRELKGESLTSAAYLGVRYGLVCWLDEVFTHDHAFGQRWTENKLESQLYGTNDRAWKFWQQAKLSQLRNNVAALEGFYWCVALGFRGQLREDVDKVRGWCNQVKLRLGHVPELDFPDTGESIPLQSAPPLFGRSRFCRMAVVAWFSLLVLIPLISYALTSRATT